MPKAIVPGPRVQKLSRASCCFSRLGQVDRAAAGQQTGRHHERPEATKAASCGVGPTISWPK